MYIVEAVEDLEAALNTLCGDDSTAYVAHGRNNGAEDAFLRRLEDQSWRVDQVAEGELHPRYFAPDVTVLMLQRR